MKAERILKSFRQGEALLRVIEHLRGHKIKGSVKNYRVENTESASICCYEVSLL